MTRLLNAGHPSQHVLPPWPLQTPPPGHDPMSAVDFPAGLGATGAGWVGTEGARVGSWVWVRGGECCTGRDPEPDEEVDEGGRGACSSGGGRCAVW